jgi:biopolymer transport protein ExbD
MGGPHAGRPWSLAASTVTLVVSLFCGGLATAETSADRLVAAQIPSVVVFVGGRDNYQLDGSAIHDLATLRTEVGEAEKRVPSPKIYFWGPPDQPFAEISHVLYEVAFVELHGVPEIGLVAEPPTTDPVRQASAIADAATLPPTPSFQPMTTPEIVNVHIDLSGAVSWDDKELPDDAAFEALINAVPIRSPQPEFHVTPETLTPYLSVVRTIARIESHGFWKIGLISRN